jgi:hypothetical protein
MLLKSFLGCENEGRVVSARPRSVIRQGTLTCWLARCCRLTTHDMYGRLAWCRCQRWRGDRAARRGSATAARAEDRGSRSGGCGRVCDRRREDGFTVSTCGARSLAHVSRWLYVPASSGADSFPFSFPPLSKVLFPFLIR